MAWVSSSQTTRRGWWREQPKYDVKYLCGVFCRMRPNRINWLPNMDGEIC